MKTRVVVRERYLIITTIIFTLGLLMLSASEARAAIGSTRDAIARAIEQ